jgi:hypothetical protein
MGTQVCTIHPTSPPSPQVLQVGCAFNSSQQHDLARWVFTLVGKFLCEKGRLGRFLHLSMAFTQGGRVFVLVGKFLCLLTSSYACWQVRTLSLALDDMMHHKMKHSQDSGLRSALATPWAVSPYSRKCLVPWALPTT